MNWQAVIKHLRELSARNNLMANSANSHFPHPQADELRAEARTLSTLADALEAGLK